MNQESQIEQPYWLVYGTAKQRINLTPREAKELADAISECGLATILYDSQGEPV